MSPHNRTTLHPLFAKMVSPLILIGSLILLYPATPQARSNSKILIINSDGSVEKYQQAEAGFRQSLGIQAGSIVTVQLDGDNATNLGKRITQENPELIYSIGSKALQLAIPESGNRPLLFSSVINWERFGRAKNRYGIANELSLPQELAYLRYLLPERKRIGLLYDPRYNRERMTEARLLARESGLELVEQIVERPENLPIALNTLLPKVDLLWLMADPGVLVDRPAIEKIFAAAAQYKKPVYAYSEAMLGFGASVVVAADGPTIGRQAANLALSILQKNSIEEGVQAPAGSRITLNTCQLSTLKANYNKDALDAVNQLVECR